MLKLSADDRPIAIASMFVLVSFTRCSLGKLITVRQSLNPSRSIVATFGLVFSQRVAISSPRPTIWRLPRKPSECR